MACSETSRRGPTRPAPAGDPGAGPCRASSPVVIGTSFIQGGTNVRPPRHARLGKVLGAVGPPAALLCIGYAAFARWPQAIAPDATRGGTPLTAHERTVGRTMAAELPALPTGAGRLGREARLLDDPGSTAGEIPRSPTVQLNPPPLARPAIESAPYPGGA